MSTRSVGFLAFVALFPVLALAEAPVIEHQKVKCIVAEKYPRMDAGIIPVEVAQARVYFKPEGVPTWYYVNMKRVAKGYEGVLPKPKKQMIGKHILYYLQATAGDLAQVTSEETDPRVVAKKEDCQNEPVAGFASHPPVAVFPNVPAGFAVGGAVGPAVIGTTLAAGAGTGVVLATRGGNEPAPAPTPPVTPPSTPPSTPPTTPPSTPPADPCANNQAPRADFEIAPNPPVGVPPLGVRFNNCRTTDPEGDAILYSYDFGDGSSDADPGTPCRLDHTYSRPGTYNAVVCVGDACRPSASCKRYTVRVEGPVVPVDPCANDSTPPTVDVTNPPTDFFVDGSTLGASADASDPAGVTQVVFRADEDPTCGSPLPCDGPCPPPVFLDEQTDTTAPYTTIPPLSMDNSESCCICVVLQVAGTDACGNASTPVVVRGLVDRDGCCGVGIARRSAAKSGRLPQSPSGQSPSWVSQLEAPEAAGQVVLNKEAVSFAGSGLSRHTAALRRGENRIEAQLVKAAGKPGAWRFDLGAIEGFEAGSLRVAEGEVALLTDRMVVFRLKGQAGERVAFVFRVK